MASSILKGLVTNYGKLGYQLWHRPLKMASLVYEREIGGAVVAVVYAQGPYFNKAATTTRTSSNNRLMSETIAVHVYYNFRYIPFPSSAKQQREMIKFCILENVNHNG